MNASALIASRPALVFDLDGTLANTATDLWLALNCALAECGLPEVGIELVLGSLHGGLEETARTAGGRLAGDVAVWRQLCRSYARHYQQREHASSVLYDGVLALLDAGRQRGAVLAVCTNKSRDEALALLDRLGIKGHFDCVVGGDNAAFRKPHPGPLLQALAEMSMRPDQALLIGDSHVDAQCAAAAGVTFVLHTGGYGGARAGACLAHARFHDYRELV